MGAWGAAASTVGGAIFGSKDKAGILGTGQFEGEKYDINKDAFYNNEAMDKDKAEMQTRLAGVDARGAPTMQGTNVDKTTLGPASQMSAASAGPAATIGGSAYEKNQNNYVNSLEQQAAGKGPSLAAGQLQAATERNTANQLAMAASGKPGNTSLAMRNVASNSAALGQQAAHDSAQMKIQEQQNAQAQLGGALSSFRGQDMSNAQNQAQLNQSMALSNAGFKQQANAQNQGALNQFGLAQGQMTQATNLAQAGFNQQANSQNQQAWLANQQMNDAMARYYTQANTGLDMNAQQNKMAYEGMMSGQQNDLNNTNAGGYANAAAARSNMWTSVAKGVAASDEEAKTNIKEGNEFINKFMKQMQSHSSANAQPKSGAWAGLSKSMDDAYASRDAMAAAEKKGGMEADSQYYQQKLKEASESAGRAKMIDTSSKALSSAPPPPVRTTGPTGFDGSPTALPSGGAPTSDEVDKYGVPKGNTDPFYTAPSAEPDAATVDTAADAASSVDAADLEAASDEETKTNVSPGKASIKEFLDKAKPYHYEYKDSEKDKPGRGLGEYVSPMAQDLEKTELGKDMVTEGPDGKKMVDYGKGFGAMLAGISSLNKRLEDLESRKAKK